MKKIFLLILGLLLCTNSFAKTKFSEVKKALKEDGYGKAVPEKFHHLNSPKAINPVSVSDFSIIGDKSIRFESNDGECWKEPKWNDCTNDRERTELYYKKKPWKKERWYRFYIYLPKDYNSIAPAKMSLIQWKRHKPSKVLVMFQHMHAGLTFNRNGDSFKDSYVVLKRNEELLGISRQKRIAAPAYLVHVSKINVMVQNVHCACTSVRRRASLLISSCRRGIRGVGTGAVECR